MKINVFIILDDDVGSTNQNTSYSVNQSEAFSDWLTFRGMIDSCVLIGYSFVLIG